MGVNRSSLSRAMHGRQRSHQRAPARKPGPAQQDVSVSGFSPVRMKKGGAYEQTIFGKHLDKINRPNGVRLGAVQLPIIAASSDGHQLVVRVFSYQGINITANAKLFLAGNRGGTFYTWVFGPNDVGAPKGFRFGGDPGGTLPVSSDICPSGLLVKRSDGTWACIEDVEGASGRGGRRTAQASGRNRARVSRFSNVPQRGYRFGGGGGVEGCNYAYTPSCPPFLTCYADGPPPHPPTGCATGGGASTGIIWDLTDDAKVGQSGSGRRTAQASGRNRPRVSRFSNVPQRGYRFGAGADSFASDCPPHKCTWEMTPSGHRYCLCDFEGQSQMGLRAGPPGGPLPPGYPPGGGPPPPPPPPPNPYVKPMGLKTAQASGRNRARLSRFTNVRRR